jgi:hypothetical protein
MDLLYLHAKKLVKSRGAEAPTSGGSTHTVAPALVDAGVALQAQDADSSEISDASADCAPAVAHDVQEVSPMDDLVDHNAAPLLISGAPELTEEFRKAEAANEQLRSENAHLQSQLETMDLLYLHAMGLIDANGA